MNVPSILAVGHLGSPTISTGQVWILGGELDAINPSVITYIGNGGVGQLTLSNGVLRTSSLRVANGSNPGTITIAGGTLITDYLSLPHTNSQFAFISGQLIVAQVISNGNGRAFAVGDGSGPALLSLGTGHHVFSNGLAIASGARLAGCGGGTISGSVLNNGVIETSCSGRPLVFTDGVTNNATLIASNGGLLKFVGPVVNNSVIDITGGGVQFLGGVSGSGMMLVPPLRISLTDNDAVISIQSAMGNSYQLQACSSLSLADWTDVGSPWSGTGGLLSLPDPGGAANIPGRFYRVRIGSEP
jgi:hypothetical protein